VMNKKNAKSSTAYLGLGSNMGDKRDNIEKSIMLLSQNPGIEIVLSSKFYETAPVGLKDQPDYINAAIKINTNLNPHDLLAVCLGIEKELLRVRTIRWGPRTIDIDILIYDDLILNEVDLVLPHPLMHEREFVLSPMMDIAPSLIHPVYKLTIKQLHDRIIQP